MNKIKFTKEESKEIKKTLNIVLDDIRELWKVSQVEAIEVCVSSELEDTDLYYLIVNDNSIFITDIIHDDTVMLELRTPFGLVKRTNNLPVSFKFIKGYEKIRPKIEREIKIGIKEKGYGFEALDEVKRKYDKEALIEINLPDSNNQHIVEVTQEDGRTIGTIDFGNRSIRIITDGDISLVNRPSYLPKIKRR